MSSRAPGTEPDANKMTFCCVKCGMPTVTTRSLEEHAVMLANVGWKTAGIVLVCPECCAGVIRRWVPGSKGNAYVARFLGDAWRCSCPGYTYRGRCKHSDALT